MSNEYDHSIERLQHAQNEVYAAEDRVNDLIAPLLEAFMKLAEWKTKPIGFREDKDGSSSIPENPNQINLNEMPFLKPVAEAIARHKRAVGELRGAES